jgi:hypothetical protein
MVNEKRGFRPSLFYSQFCCLEPKNWEAGPAEIVCELTKTGNSATNSIFYQTFYFIAEPLLVAGLDCGSRIGRAWRLELPAGLRFGDLGTVNSVSRFDHGGFVHDHRKRDSFEFSLELKLFCILGVIESVMQGFIACRAANKFRL